MNSFILISGPTGVGKTDFVDQLIMHLPRDAEIINADSGQMYSPLSIGTAKPDYLKSPTKHHLFDILTEPHDYTVAQWRKSVISLMHTLWERNVLPVIVGGSSFYIQSLFFPPQGSAAETSIVLPDEYRLMTNRELWQELSVIDADRARSIHPHDRYRVERALALWLSSDTLPSEYSLQFDPPGMCAFFYLTRDRDELNGRINQRVKEMLAAGWIEEVQRLDMGWRDFLLKKKLIGYPDIIEYIGGPALSHEELSERISAKTRAYAKRQLTFWRMLYKKLEQADPRHEYLKIIEEVNLSEIANIASLVYKINRYVLALNSKGL